MYNKIKREIYATELPLRAQRVYVRVEYKYVNPTSVYNISPDYFNIWNPHHSMEGTLLFILPHQVCPNEKYFPFDSC